MQLIKPTPDDVPLFDRLAQLYAHDFSEMANIMIGADGLFPSHECFTKIWTDSDRHARIIKVNGEVAGFAIVLRFANADYDIEQFFVLRKFRRQGVGRLAALALFQEFTGKWTVEQITENPTAQVFWRSVIAEFTDGHYTDSGGDDPVQNFTSPPFAMSS